MYNVLKSVFKRSDQEFQPIWDAIQDKLDGDFPQIWADADRPWHPKTRKEIYSLLLVTNRLGVTLPIYVVEQIAFWIQLIQLRKDFHRGKLLLQLVLDGKEVPGLYSGYTSPFNTKGPFHLKPTVKLQIISQNKTDSRLAQLSFMEVIKSDIGHYDQVPYPSPDAVKYWQKHHRRTIRRLLARKDRYRIVVPNRAEWDKFYESLK